MVNAVRGAGLTIYIALFDGALGQVLTATGQLDRARAQLDTGLEMARDTGMSFYDAELLRLRAHTHEESAARQADLDAALEPWLAATAQPLFELRAALDDFELRGEPARAALVDAASRVPADSGWPELARTHAALDQMAP